MNNLKAIPDENHDRTVSLSMMMLVLAHESSEIMKKTSNSEVSTLGFNLHTGKNHYVEWATSLC